MNRLLFFIIVGSSKISLCLSARESSKYNLGNEEESSEIEHWLRHSPGTFTRDTSDGNNHIHNIVSKNIAYGLYGTLISYFTSYR